MTSESSFRSQTPLFKEDKDECEFREMHKEITIRCLKINNTC